MASPPASRGGDVVAPRTPDALAQQQKQQPPSDLPDGIALFDTQVAGHPFDLDKHKIGMLRGSNGRVLKPIENPLLGERERAFYENLSVSGHPTDVELSRYTPTYYGTKEMRIFDRRIKFLELEDITDGMSEPCVMDVKIGRRCWDPLATAEKRASEDLKYAETRKAYGFCIPGFQVYRVPSGSLQKFDKSYGKKLNSETLVEALELFLNATASRPPSRELLVQLLSILWKILALFREQRRYRIFSSSLLVAYDAKRLRQHTRRQLNNSFAESVLRAPIGRYRSFSGAARSLGSLNQIGSRFAAATPSPLSSPSASPGNSGVFAFPPIAKIDKSSRKTGSGGLLFLSPRPGSPKLLDKSSYKGSTGNLLSPSSPKLDSPTRSPRLNRTIHRLQTLKRSISLQNCETLPEKSSVEFLTDPCNNIEQKPVAKKVADITVHKLVRTHSYSNNYDADIIQMKEDYAALLHELSNSCEEKQNWVRVYMIDFAHVFPAEDGELDNNYLEGIESLIKLLEKFLA